MRGRVAAIVVALISVGWLVPVTGASNASGLVQPAAAAAAWTTGANLPVGISGNAAVSDGRYAYTFGGGDSSGKVVSTPERYDPIADAWQPLAPIPTPVAFSSAAYAPTENKIYLFGGQNSTGIQSLVQVYDVATDTWSTATSMPGPAFFQTGGYFNGKVYLAGGESAPDIQTTSKSLWIYDVATDTWATGANLPDKVLLAGGDVIDGKFYVAGGANADNGFGMNTLYVYDIAADTWSVGPSLPYQLWGQGSAVANGQLYIFGGENDTGTLASTQIFDPSTNTWSSGPDLNVPRYYATGTAVGDLVVAPGGRKNTSPYASDATELLGRFVLLGANQLVLSNYPASTPSGSSFNLTVSIQDGSGNPLPAYVGTVHLSSTDAQAVLPSDYTFTATDAGTHTFTPVTLNTPGRNAQQSQTITVADMVNKTLAATTSPISVTPLTTAPTVTQGWYLIGGSPLSLWPGATGLFSWNALTGQWFTPTGKEPPGTGAWEFVATQATNTITVQHCAHALTLAVQVRRWNMIGNPCDVTVTLPAGTRVLLWDSTHQRYLPATAIPPGQGAWALPLANPLSITPN